MKTNVLTKIFRSRRPTYILLGSIAMICFALAISPSGTLSNAIDENTEENLSFTSDISGIEVANNALAETFSKAFSKTLSESPQKTPKNDTENIKIAKAEADKIAAVQQAKDATLKEDANANGSQNLQHSKEEKNAIHTNDDPLEAKINPQGEWRTVTVRAKDTMAKIFARHGFSTKDLHQMMAVKNPVTQKLVSLQPGQTLKLKVQDKQVNELNLDYAPGSMLSIVRGENGFQIEHKQLPIEKQLAFGKGKIHTSLFGSAKQAGIDNKVIAQMVEIFGWNIDFSLDLRPNDTFRVLFEEKYIDGERIETGNILAAEIVNGGKKHQAIRYTDKSGSTGYFSPDGYGLHQAFLRYPLNFTRISSGFGKRRHPLLHRMRQHKGVDYSAPTGTPVQATGDAKVIFAGTRRGYGKVVELQHGSRYTTLYAHLSRFAKSLKAGHAVKQGQVIGYVGATGLATGPHLHYEFRIDGIHRDPLTVALPKKSPISGTQKQHFLAHAKEMLKLMDQHESKVNVARSEFSLEKFSLDALEFEQGL